MVSERTGLEMRVLTGTQEATYIGKGLRSDPQIRSLHRFVQMDLGGGSLELIRFEHDHIAQAISLQLGAVRLSERFIQDREAALPSATQAVIREHVHASITASGFNFGPDAGPLIATGGAVVVTRAILAAQAGRSIEAHPSHISRHAIQQLAADLSILPLHERMATPHLPAARADILPTALVTIDTVLQLAQLDGLTHSFYNLRYGLASEALARTV